MHACTLRHQALKALQASVDTHPLDISAHLQLLGRQVRYRKVYAHAVTAIAARGPRMELPADCVCSSNLIAHRAQQVLTCNGSNVSLKSAALADHVVCQEQCAGQTALICYPCCMHHMHDVSSVAVNIDIEQLWSETPENKQKMQ